MPIFVNFSGHFNPVAETAGNPVANPVVKSAAETAGNPIANAMANPAAETRSIYL